MADVEMPLILDSAMSGADPMQVELDVDLFGDPVLTEAVALALPPHGYSRPLMDRVETLRSRGCCQYGSWAVPRPVASTS
jgi:hypothetical protein